MTVSDTIFAQATARGRAGIAVIRLSGPESNTSVHRLFSQAVAARRPALRWLHDPETGEALDQALVLIFPAPASFTGEEVAELHLHGSPAVCKAIERVLEVMGLRPAEAGEVTRRALMNGRLDL